MAARTTPAGGRRPWIGELLTMRSEAMLGEPAGGIVERRERRVLRPDRVDRPIPG